MKKLTNFFLDIHFKNLDLDEVEKMRFVFVQDGRRLLFDYPSESAFRNESTISLKWTAEQTKMFQSGKEMSMDYIVKLNGIDQNPETDIVQMVMNPTLFRPEEVDGF